VSKAPSVNQFKQAGVPRLTPSANEFKQACQGVLLELVTAVQSVDVDAGDLDRATLNPLISCFLGVLIRSQRYV